jgi:hypothetical protein
MHYKLSAPSRLRLSAKDRNAIEFMLGRVGDSNSMAYQPKGRTGYHIRRSEDGHMVSIRRGDEVYEIVARLMPS